MAKVQGLTIEIGADAKKFDKQVRKMNRSIKRTRNEVYSLTKSLEMDWDNKKFLKAQRLAQQNLDKTENKAQALRKRLKYLEDTDVSKNSVQYEKIRGELAESELSAQRYRKELKKIRDMKFTRLGTQFQKLGRSLSSLGSTLTMRVTAPLAAAGAAATKLFLDLDTAMRKVSTLFGDIEVDIESLTDEIQKMASTTGIASTELSEGLYQALSAGVDVTEDMGTAMTFLETATSLAKAGFTTTASSVDILTTVMNAYGFEIAEAARVSDVLLATQNKGKTTVDQLAGSIAKVIPTAANLGVEFEDVASSLAALTAQGVPTEQATTSLNQVLTQLGKSGTTASNILREQTGKSFLELAKDGISLQEVFKILTEGAEESDTAMIDLFGNVRAAKGFMALTSNEGEGFADALDGIKNSAGATNEALDKVNGPAYELKGALQQLKTVVQDLGAIMTPVIVSVASKLTSLVAKFNSLSEKTQGTILKLLGFAAALGPLFLVLGKVTSGIGGLIKILPKLSGALSFLAAHPIILALIGIAGALSLIYKRSEIFRNAVNDLIKTLGSAFKPVLSALISAFKDIWQAMQPLMKALAFVAGPALTLLTKGLTMLIKLMAISLTGAIKLVAWQMETLYKGIGFIIEGIVKGFEWVVNKVIDFVNIMIDQVNKVRKLLGKDELGGLRKVNFEVSSKAEPITAVENNKTKGSSTQTDTDRVTAQSSLNNNASGVNNIQNQTNVDNSQKRFEVNLTIENYATELDYDDVVDQINKRLAEKF